MHLWFLLSHQLSDSLGLDFNLLEGKFGVKEFIVNLVRSQESYDDKIHQKVCFGSWETESREKEVMLTLADYKDLCRLVARGLGLSGLDTAEQLLEDP